MGKPGAEASYIRRVLITAGIGAATLLLLLLLWQVWQVVLVFFAAVLFAVLLDGMTRIVRRATRAPRLLGLGLVFGMLVVAIVGFAWVVGPQVSSQLSELGTRIPAAMEHIASLLRQEAWGEALLETLPAPQEIVPPAAGILGQISGVFSTTLGAITNAVIIAVAGAYLAIEPRPYVNGVLRLLPIDRRAYGREVLRVLGRALRWWLIGRIASMVAVGLLTAVGLWLVDVPLVLALAFIAGLLSFVPYLGPILSAIPALLVALVASPLQAVYVVLVYSTVQFLEGNFITPIIQERAVSLAPAVLLIAQLGMGVLFGLMGVLLATPLVVVVIVLIQMLYVRDVLGDTIRVLGQHEHSARDEG
ncbi:MAG: AI-2E family transporter [Gammaproteobacteria bacterium]|nr:AI-2E family transporter [Gammaproteobacteria bacterium]